MGDLQATVMGMLSAVLFFVISHAKPLDKLSPQRPHPNIWSAYVFLSLIGQFAVHMAYLVTMYFGALAAMPKVCSWRPSRPCVLHPHRHGSYPMSLLTCMSRIDDAHCVDRRPWL